MYKRVINNEEELNEFFLLSNMVEYRSHAGPENPDEYPCVVMWDMDDDMYVVYDFVYLDDFKLPNFIHKVQLGSNSKNN